MIDALISVPVSVQMLWVDRWPSIRTVSLYSIWIGQNTKPDLLRGSEYAATTMDHMVEYLMITYRLVKFMFSTWWTQSNKYSRLKRWWVGDSPLSKRAAIANDRYCHVMYKLLYPSIRVRTAPPVSVRVRTIRVSVSFSLRILFCMCGFLR